MSGRAGRRGLDTVGTVIITAWADTMPDVCHYLITLNFYLSH